MEERQMCPVCGTGCDRDEHPDGIAVSPWSCPNGCWFEGIDRIEEEDLEEPIY
jgi:hypothetical protein